MWDTLEGTLCALTMVLVTQDYVTQASMVEVRVVLLVVVMAAREEEVVAMALLVGMQILILTTVGIVQVGQVVMQ